MNKKPYKYILDIEGITKEVTPLNTSQFAIEYNSPSDSRFSYVPKITKKVAFVGEDFDFIYEFENSNKHCRWAYLDIQKQCSGIYSTYQTARIKMTSGIFDLDKCVVELDIEINSNYACFDDNKEIEVDLLQKIETPVTAKIFRGTIEYVDYTSSTSRDFYKTGEFSEADPAAAGWTLWKYTANNVNIPTSWHYYYAREIITVDCDELFDPAQWIEVEGCSGSTKKMARPVVFYKRTITGYDAGGRPPRQGYTFGPNFEGWLFDAEVFAFNAIDNGMLLSDILTYFSQSFCGKPVKSVFFNINPDADFAVIYPLLPKGKSWNNIVFQKSDVKRPNDYSNASRAVTTYKKFILALCNTYNLQFTITDTEFRIEHISYFTRVVGLDTTLPIYSKWGKQARKYSYLQEKLPEQEVFEMMEQHNVDFVGLPIEYKGACRTVGQVDKIQTDIFSTDATFVMEGGIRDEDGNEKGNVSDSGFFLMATEKIGTDYFILRENGILDPFQRLNNVLAWAQLHRDYWKWERPQINGFMNGVYTMFQTSRPVKKGEKVTVHFCCGDTLKLTDYVKTILGDGIVERATYNLYNETLVIDPLYRDNTATFICFAPISFTFDHVEDETVFFNTTFLDDSTYTTEIEVTKPNGEIDIVGPFSEVSGLDSAFIEGLGTGNYKFRKRIICGEEVSDWTYYTTYFNESTECTATIPEDAVSYVSYDSTTKRFKFKILYSLLGGNSIEAEVTRPDAAVFVNTAFGMLSSGQYIFQISKDKTPFATGPSGLYKFRFRLRCNSIAAGPYTTAYLEATI